MPFLLVSHADQSVGVFVANDLVTLGARAFVQTVLRTSISSATRVASPGKVSR